MSIKLDDIKKLRDATGAGMMDCKKALTEASGDFEKAIEELRKKGQKVSAKRADRDALEGAVIAEVSEDYSKGVVVKLSSETDFVSKNEEFVRLTQQIAKVALEHFPASKADLLELDLNGAKVSEHLNDLLAKFQEKIELTDYERLEADMVVSYIHMGNKAGVLVGLNASGDHILTAGKDVAMQVAAMKPIALDKDQVDEKTIATEIEIGKEQARAEGKPEAMIEKIAMGKLNKFYKENTLLNQAFVKQNKMSVSDYLKSVDPNLTVTDFKHVRLG